MTSDPLARYLSQTAVKAHRRARLRPMSGSQITDLALRVYRSLGWTFLRLCALPSVFCLAALAFVFYFAVPQLQFTRDASSVTGQVWEAFVVLLVSLGVAGPLFIVGITLSSSIVVRLAADYLLGNPLEEGDAMREAIAGLGKLFLVMLWEMLAGFGAILVSVVIMLAGSLLSTVTPSDSPWAGIVAVVGIIGLMVGIIIFLAIASSHALSVPVAILEGATARAAARRSRALMKVTRYHGSGSGHVWGLYGLLALVSLVIWGGCALIFNLAGLREVLENATMGVPLQALVLRAIDLLPACVMVWALVPVWATAITVIYYERRIRLEGYDIEVLASEIRPH